ncbi:MAG: bifunctional folylpolyglutamate synthase/dihydrofolate synthase [Proteobacteria bacterium]|nr:bifunctional folylpolyglutamate synthase/dihydrofolate synthase [Pseudomonadota bacterium]
MNYQQTIERLFSLQKFGIKFGLSSTENLLARLDRPHKRLAVLHLAGTNGKGSVGAAATSMLTEAGYRVGFYTSPHLVSFRERFVISGEMISKEGVIKLADRVWEVANPEEPPTFFEFATAMAFLHFAESRVDLAVMETGMGGRLDATNVAEPRVGVITNISIEHTDYLGRTLAEIAGEKAGIIKPGMDVITGEKRKGVRDIFEATARERGARLLVLGRDFRVRTRPEGGFDYYGFGLNLKHARFALQGPHQARNAALALAAVERLSEQGFRLAETHLRQGLERTFWPGRAEMFSGPPPLMLDGAHNPGAARALARLLEGMNYRRLHLVLGVMEDKDVRGIVTILMPLAQALYLTRPDYFRSASLDRLARETRGFTGPVHRRPVVSEAIEAARAQAGPEDLVLVTGSLFTVGEARTYLAGAVD